MMKWIRTLIVSLAVVMTPWLSSVESSPALLKAKARSEEVSLQLREYTTMLDRTNALLKTDAFINTVDTHPELNTFLANASLEEVYALALMVALDQFDTVFNGLDTIENTQEALHKLLSTLAHIEKFYEPIGGILGYHSTVINLMTASEDPIDVNRYVPPPCQDIRTTTPEMWTACYEGVEKLGRTASIFALGGAGDRLNLIDEATKEPLPAARLLFCGRSLFEGLMRDVEAQEYWHYRVFSNQVTMPILIMTSKEKHNDFHLEAMGKAANWFGHRHDAIRRMVQPLVPVIDTEGQWAMSAPLELALKPGGHGVIWKLAEDSGSVKWLTFHGIDAAVIRQVNNPLAGLDKALPTLIGYGLLNHKSFGFLSCPTKPGYAEGLNVLSVKKTGSSAQATISNIEYTQFSILKNLLPNLFKEGACPANTNILYINLHKIHEALSKNPIPGMIVNAKTNVDIIQEGKTIKKTGGRLESCMQNIADGLMSPINADILPSVQPEALSTFLLLQDREKFFSATKKAYQQGQNPVETTASCLYDWNRAMRSLLTSSCHFTLPKEQTLDEFLRDGPSVTFSFHPAMGPLWEVIGQKLSRGTIAEGSELELEIAEIACTDLSVNGSLRILAEIPTGPISGISGRTYTDKIGRAKLNGVSIVNKGLKSRDITSVLKGSVEHHETCEIILEGFSEVVATNVTISGNFRLVVPNEKRAILSQNWIGKVVTTFEDITSPSWQYAVDWQRSSAPKLQLKEAA
jgi:UDP-N-acetylglucosamine pyrophosphorylase